jgi:proteasome accessory factor B
MGDVAVDKAERLINLTMALLASRRFLSKNEIYSIVPGYSGSAETRERMFERDKNDLRDLGLEIEVGNDDPLFDDEAGYRIDAQRYSFDLGELDGVDLALLSLSAANWQSSLLSKSGQSAIRKLESISASSDTESLHLPHYSPEVPGKHFEILWKAITDKRRVSFTYNSQHDSYRTIEPYGLTLNRGFWYLVGRDLDKEEIRLFKVVRIADDLEMDNSKKSFDQPDPVTLRNLMRNNGGSDQRIEVDLLIAQGRAYEIRRIAQIQPSSDEWESATLVADSQFELFELLARAGVSVIITSPQQIRDEYIDWIRGKRNV